MMVDDDTPPGDRDRDREGSAGYSGRGAPPALSGQPGSRSRLRWTKRLHRVFVAAVQLLGGADKVGLL